MAPNPVETDAPFSATRFITAPLNANVYVPFADATRLWQDIGTGVLNHANG